MPLDGATAGVALHQGLSPVVTDEPIALGAAQKRRHRNACHSIDRGFHAFLQQPMNRPPILPSTDRFHAGTIASGLEQGNPLTTLWGQGRERLPVGLERAESVSGRQRPRFGFRGFAPTAIQTGEHRNRETGVQVHRSFQQHGATAFITGSHVSNATTHCSRFPSV